MPPRVTILLVIAALGLLVRVPAMAEPLGIDQSLWASAVNGIARGQVLYVDVFDQKPPGIFLIYLGAFSVLGWTAGSIAWLDLAAAGVTAALVFAIARRLAGTATGALAAALYTVLTVPSWLYRYGGFLERSVAETFVTICVGIAGLCGIGLLRRTSPGLAAGLGLAIGTAVMFKPNAALYFPALWLWIAWHADRRAGGSIRLAAISIAGCLVTPALMLAWLWSEGALSATWVAIVEFNRYYVSEGVTLSGFALEFSKAVWLRMKTDPLWMAGAVGSLVVAADLARRRGIEPLPALAVAWGAAAALAILANGVRLYNSYFIQALAPLSLLAAWLLMGLGRRDSIHRAAAGGAALLMVPLLFVVSDYPARVYDSARADLDRLLARMDRVTYLDRFGGYATGRGYSARANDELAAYIRAQTSPEDRIYLFGINGAGVYFLADRLAAQRFLRVNFFVPSGFPDPAFELPAVLDQLADERPAYLIFETLHSTSAMAKLVDRLQEHPLVRRLLEGYRLEARIEDFTLYRRQSPEPAPSRDNLPR